MIEEKTLVQSLGGSIIQAQITGTVKHAACNGALRTDGLCLKSSPTFHSDQVLGVSSLSGSKASL